MLARLSRAICCVQGVETSQLLWKSQFFKRKFGFRANVVAFSRQFSLPSGSTRASSHAESVFTPASPTSNLSEEKLGRILTKAVQDFQRTIEGWSLDDLSLILTALSRLRKAEAAANGILPLSTAMQMAQEVEDVNFIRYLRRMLELSHACYLGTTDAFSSSIQDATYIAGDWKAYAKHLRPSYFVSVCHVTQQVVVAVRGSYSVDDALMAAIAVPEPFMNGYVHRGAWLNARRLVTAIQPHISQLRDGKHRYNVVLTGHSLGGATATVAALLLRDEFPDIRAVVFNSPPVLSRGLAAGCASYVWSVVHGDDLVSRFSVHALEALRIELANTNWKTALRDDAMDEVKKLRVVQLAADAQAALSKQASSILDNVYAWCAGLATEQVLFGKVVALMDVLRNPATTVQAVADAKAQLKGALQQLLVIDGSMYDISKEGKGDGEISGMQSQAVVRQSIKSAIEELLGGESSGPSSSLPRTSEPVSHNSNSAITTATSPTESIWAANATVPQLLERVSIALPWLATFKKAVAPAVSAIATPAATVVTDSDGLSTRQLNAMETMHYYIAGTPLHLVPKLKFKSADATAKLLMFTPGDAAVDSYFGRIVLSKTMFSDHFAAATTTTIDDVLITASQRQMLDHAQVHDVGATPPTTRAASHAPPALT